MAFVGASSFVYQGVLGFSPLAFGASMALNALGLASGGLLSARLAHLRVHPARAVAWALPGAVTSCLLVTAAAASPWPLLLVVPVFANAVLREPGHDELHGARHGARARTAGCGLRRPRAAHVCAEHARHAAARSGRRGRLGGADGRGDDGLHRPGRGGVRRRRVWIARHPESGCWSAAGRLRPGPCGHAPAGGAGRRRGSVRVGGAGSPG